jgi:hypothetical protein
VNVSIARRGMTPNRASSTGPAMCPAGPRAMSTAAAKASFYAIVARTAIWLVHQFIHNKSYLTPYACSAGSSVHVRMFCKGNKLWSFLYAVIKKLKIFF